MQIEMHSLDLEAMKRLVSQFGSKSPPAGYYEYVHYAADLPTLEYLKSIGAKMKLSSHEYGNIVSPMDWAVKKGDPSLVKFVKDNCSSPYDIYSGLDTLLRCNPVKKEIFELLQDANINDDNNCGTFFLIRNKFRTLAFETTRWKKNPDAIVEIDTMRHIARVLNRRRVVHNPYITEAAQEGDIVGVKLLWPSADNATRELVVRIAAEYGLTEIVDFGLDKGVELEPSILSASALSNPNLFHGLLRIRLPFDDETPQVINRALEYAVACDREDSLKAAFEAEIDPRRNIGIASLMDFAEVYYSNDCRAYLSSLGVPEISKDTVYKQYRKDFD